MYPSDEDFYICKCCKWSVAHHELYTKIEGKTPPPWHTKHGTKLWFLVIVLLYEEICCLHLVFKIELKLLMRCVVVVSFMCHWCVFDVLYLCHQCVIPLSLTCHTFVIDVSYLCHWCVIHVSYVCHWWVVPMSLMCIVRVY